MNRRGFTLIEVLVALTVIAVAMVALLTAAGRMGRDASHLRQSTLASYVAANVLAETRLAQAFPPVSRSSGSMPMGREEFRYELVVQDTPEPGLRRLDVHVFLAQAAPSEAPIFTLSGFAGRP